MPNSPVSAGIWSGSSLYMSYACCHNHCEFICAASLMDSEDSILLSSFKASDSYILYSMILASLEGEVWHTSTF